MQIRDRIRELRRVRAAELRPNPRNWRVHPPQQQDALRGVLINYNQFDPRLGIAIMGVAGMVLFAIALVDFRRT